MTDLPDLPLDALPLPSALVDVAGRLVAVNGAWLEDASPDDPPWRHRRVGERLVAPGSVGAETLAGALEDVLSGASRRCEASVPRGEAAGGLGVSVGVVDGERQRHALVMVTGAGREGGEAPEGGMTSPRELEDQVRSSQRIESLGRLAGGIAHDFNNLITVISGHTDLLLATIPEGNVLREDLQEIRSASARAASLTRQLLAFSRRQVFQLRNLNLNEVVSGTEAMLRRIIGEDVELVFLPALDLGAMRGDPAQLEQVLMNLVVNARDAMPRGGELVIRTINVELDTGFVRRNLGATEGPHVLLEVRDTGDGMSPDVASRVFEPFFSTKEPGKGTGLGLAMVYGIVKQSNGYISVESEPGVGTAVRLFFPRVPGPAQELVPGEGGGEGPLPTGCEAILLVEDEEMVRSLARRILEGLGYRVREARDATEAVELARELGDELDLLLTDVVMPRISGRQLAEALTSEFPSLPVLFMSGYTDDALMHHGALAPGQGFLQKPFTPGSLSRRVREILDGV